MVGLLAPVVASPPLFSVRAVDLGGETFGTVTLSDARPDLSAVGITFIQMTADYLWRPLYVAKGRTLSLGAPPSEGWVWEPRAILGAGRYVVAPNSFFESRYGKGVRAARIIGGRLKVGGGLALARPSARVGSVPGGGAFEFPRSLWPARYRGREEPFGSVRVDWTRLSAGVRVGEVSFDAGTFESPMEIADTTVLLETGAGVRPLSGAVPGGYEVYGLEWVSPEGWLVVAASRRGRHFLLWLAPVRG